MSTYLITMALIFAIMVLGIGVDRLYRRFAASNPKLGPFRSEKPSCGSCSGGSGCADKACEP
jgi:hypothetical protein